MNVYLENARGLPDKAFLSVRVGDVRKQMHYKAGEQFSFEAAKVPKHFSVEVFEKVAIQQVSLADCSDGHLRTSIEMPHRMSGELMGMDVHVALEQHVEELKPRRTARHEASVRAKNYLDGYGVSKVLQGMVQSLLAAQPSSPIDFMKGYLEDHRAECEAYVPSRVKGDALSPGAPAPTAEARFTGYYRGNFATPVGGVWNDLYSKFGQGRPPPGATDVGVAEAGGIEEEVLTLPGLGDEEMPGFPADHCPDELPDLSKHHSLMAIVLRKDPGIYHRLKGLRTPGGVSLAKCMKPGVDNVGHALIRTVGLVAGDAACYEVFRELFEPVVVARHNLADSPKHTVDLDVAKVGSEPVDAAGKHVISCRLRCARNLRDVPFPPSISKEQRREVERVAVKALLDLHGASGGRYLPLGDSMSFPPCQGGMSPEEEADLDSQGLLFIEPDAQLILSSGTGRHWPDARGIFVDGQQSLAAWVNEEDHLRLIAQQDGGDLRQVFERLCRFDALLGEALRRAGHDYARSDGLGFLTSCPEHLGSGGLQVSVQVRLPNLGAKEEFKSLCRELHIQARPRSSEVRGQVWTVSSTGRLGLPEAEFVNEVAAACRRLVELEDQLERGLTPAITKAA